MKPSFLSSSLSFSRNTDVDRLMFFKHLGVMVKSGISIGDAISVLTEETSNPRLHKVFLKILHDVNNGQPLHQAMRRHPAFFDTISLHLIRLGEESGTLEQNLDYLAEQLQHKLETKNKIAGALVYPELIVVTAVVVSAGVSYYVLPKLGNLFRELGTTLPLSTKILLFLSDAMRDYGIIILASISAAIVTTAWLLRTQAIKSRWHAFQLSIPFLGEIVRNYELASFCRNFSIMLKSGLPILDSLTAQWDNTDNETFRQYVVEIRSGVEKGAGVEEAIAQKKLQHFPTIAAKMIGIGERSGRLEESLAYLADFYEDEAAVAAKSFTDILEPILLLLVGAAVAFVTMAIIAPIYSFSSSIRPR